VWRAKKVLRRLIASWEEFGKVLSQASQEGTAELVVDKGLLDLEAKIAVDLPCMYEFCTGTYLDDEIREEVRSVGELVKRFTGKALSSRLTQDEAKGMVAEWNSHFVFMNRLLGSKAGAGRTDDDMTLDAVSKPKRKGAIRKIGSNSGLRFVAKALVVIILAVVVVNLFGGPASDMLTGAITKLSSGDDSGDSSGSGYGSSGVLGRAASWQKKVQVFTAEHRSMITMVAIIVAAFAVLYLILFRS
jgi:hypothetical protein